MNPVTPAEYRQEAEALSGPLPPLLAEAEHLAQTVLLGFHGRRRGGMGDEFWQYRPARDGDAARMIDWRRSARSDAHFVQEKEWQAAQSVFLWLDEAQSMDFTGDQARLPKGQLGKLIALALSILLIRGGERVALASLGTPPRSSELQLLRIAQSFAMDKDRTDYGMPEVRNLLPHARAAFISDFMGDLAPLERELGKAADRGVRGALLQILDPHEEAFPFDGRTIFESMGKSLRHETLKAADLRDRYIERLQQRKERLEELAYLSGWQYSCHHTGNSAQQALLWVYTALERKP
ncbi:MAG: DUF58 domain-containing protein [Pseudomonadota bacterium]